MYINLIYTLYRVVQECLLDNANIQQTFSKTKFFTKKMNANELKIRLTELAAKLKAEINDRLPIVAGKMAVDFFKESFQKEGFTDENYERWPEVKRRRDPRVRGARATRKILTGDTGDLGESITYRKTSPGEVTITAEAYSKDGFNYAPVHNEGVTDAGRNRSTIIPKRQFIGPSKMLEHEIEKEIERKLKDIMKL